MKRSSRLLVSIIAFGALALGTACGVEEIERHPGALPSTPSAGGSGAGTGGSSAAGSNGANSGGSEGRSGGTGGSSDVPSKGAGPVDAAGGSGGPNPAAGSAMGGQGGVTSDAGPAAPTETEGVMLGGTFVPRSKAIVILHLGHSNMAGRATGPADLMPYFYAPDPHLWIYAGGGMYKQAQEPTAPDVDTGMSAGPGMALLRLALAAAGPDAHVISVGHGHSGSYGGNCAAFRKGGLLYGTVMTRANELKGKVTFAGLFTMLGQSEHNATVAEQKGFAVCMKGLIDDIRGDLGVPDLPFMIGGYELGITKVEVAPSTPFAMSIIAQMLTIPMMTTRAALIQTVDLAMQDDHHFNMAGHKEWATRGMKLMIDNGWAPWAAP